VNQPRIHTIRAKNLGKLTKASASQKASGLLGAAPNKLKKASYSPYPRHLPHATGDLKYFPSLAFTREKGRGEKKKKKKKKKKKTLVLCSSVPSPLLLNPEKRDPHPITILCFMYKSNSYSFTNLLGLFRSLLSLARSAFFSIISFSLSSLTMCCLAALMLAC
jgi:hypothetical protein